MYMTKVSIIYYTIYLHIPHREDIDYIIIWYIIR